MKLLKLFLVASAGFTMADPPPAGTKLLSTFDGGKYTTQKWEVTNDPVMGGRSHSTFHIDQNSDTMNWAGETKIVPSLKAPGFCNLETKGIQAFPDVSDTTHLMMRVQTSTPEYIGWKISVAMNTLNPQFKSFKANFTIAAANTWEIISVPWDGFSNDWSPYTGNCFTKDPTGVQHYCCSKEHPDKCPTASDLSKVEQVGLWTEGVAGNFTLEVDWIGAGSGTEAPAVKFFDTTMDPPPAGTTLFATFDGAKDTTARWGVTNDPVMGGLSHSTFKVDNNAATMNWEGVTRIVPSLKAPGFCNLETRGIEKFNSAAGTTHFMMRVQTSTPGYTGFKVSVAMNTLNPQFKSFKSNFNITSANTWGILSLPWNSFSNDWSPFTGNCDTKDPNGGPQHHCCSADHPEVCPTADDLAKVEALGLWAEGVAGNFTMIIDWMGAGDGTTVSHKFALTGPGDHDYTCSAKIQNDLRYNVSGRLASNYLPFGGLPKESLVQAVCCDADYKAYAEPQFFYNNSDIHLFSYLKEGVVTTFYDPVCGIALFKTPINRTLADFMAETNEHGWPSFRDAERVSGNVKVADNGEVLSACGTHLGSNLPDSSGNRYCLDLTCISGNPTSAISID